MDQVEAVAVSGLTCSFAERKVLDGVELRVRSGESVVITGPSGSGKSTLLTCLLGLMRPDAGSVALAGVDLATLSERRLTEHRRNTVGMVFQFGELLPELTPVENVALAALLGGMEHRQAYARAAALLEELGVPREQTQTGLLSGGERQRTAVARSLITDPAVILADEPTGALDTETREAVADLLFALPRRRNCALVVVTHDLTVAERADHWYRLESGSLLVAVA
ncbi:ABC transporter ATP-binding protein [Streptomyces sp. NPDC018057]|uniref:ABC transporter ATP-binding protein n=1 Tax=unclassified Streptomyces TaxID=2593676 RepID=UPI0037AACB9F